MSFIMVDVETDGPAPGIYSMVSLGAVVVRSGLENTFYAEFHPVSDLFLPEALAVSGMNREQALALPDPQIGMRDFATWLDQVNGPSRLQFISDNNGFDWQFVNWYFWEFLKTNPFGHSSRNLGDLYKGMVKDMFKNFKHLRRTRHSHHPVDDARGNAEALLHMKEKLHLNIVLD